MERFSYEAIDANGRKRIGSEEARNRESVILKLQSQGLVLIRWVDQQRAGPRLLKTSGRTLKPQQLLQLTREMAHLLESDVPMDRVFTIIVDSAAEASIRRMAQDLKESLRGGSSLSEAMSTKKEDFSDLYINMVRAGEAGGILPQTMKGLAQFIERTEEIKRFILSSSIYPSILMSVGILSVLVIMGFVVPRFAEIFADLGQEIPLSTRVLIKASEILREWGWLIGVIAGILVVFVIYFRKTSKGREMQDRLFIGFPAIGALIRDIDVSRFARTFGTLVLSGVPLLKALSIVQEVVGNHVVKSAVAHIYDHVKQGKKVSSLMKDRKIFPAMAVQMVSLGEDTGKLGKMLVLVADELDNKVQGKIRTYLALVEPVAIVVMGLIIGGIVMSMLMAIIGINEIEF